MISLHIIALRGLARESNGGWAEMKKEWLSRPECLPPAPTLPLKRPEPSARPAGSSRLKLHELSLRPEGGTAAPGTSRSPAGTFAFRPEGVTPRAHRAGRVALTARGDRGWRRLVGRSIYARTTA